MKEKPIKPVQMAAKVGITPSRLASICEEIERTKVYRFRRTPLGSLLFEEDDEGVIAEYLQIARFFGRKKETMDMFKWTAEEKYRSHERPKWMRLMHNAWFR